MTLISGENVTGFGTEVVLGCQFFQNICGSKPNFSMSGNQSIGIDPCNFSCVGY